MLECLFHLAIHFFRHRVVPHIFAAGFGLNRESWRYGQSGICHFRQSGALAAQEVHILGVVLGTGFVFHLGLRESCCSHNCVLYCFVDSLPSVTISEKSAIVENSFSSVCSNASRLARTFASSAMTITLSKK